MHNFIKSYQPNKNQGTLLIRLYYCLQTALPVSSPAAGVITELLVADGDTVEKGQALFRIDISGA